MSERNGHAPAAEPAAIPDDLITVREASGLVPSPRGGRTNRSTLLRWINAGKLRAWKTRGTWILVSRAEVLELLKPVPVQPPYFPPTKTELLRQGIDPYARRPAADHGPAEGPEPFGRRRRGG